MATGLADAFSAFSQQTFLTGVSRFLEAISDPARSAKSVISSTLASTVPTIVADVARAKDTKERRTNTIFEAFQARIPGVREKLEPQIDVLGREIETMGNPLELMIDPTRPSPIKVSPVTQELRRLWDKGYKVSPTLLGDKAGYKGLTKQQNTELWKKAGQITNEKLTLAINNSEYQAFSDEKKSKAVDKVVDLSKTMARVSLALELTKGMSEEEAKKKIKELHENKLVNEEVLKYYLEFR